MDGRALHLLRTVFGYQEFRHHQEEVIERLIGGGDVVVVMPTGGGKSLCYQIPAMIRDGTGIVVSPLIALMRDQVSGLTQAGVRAAFLNSTQSLEEVRAVEGELLAGGLDLLYVAPERLLSRRTLDLLGRARLALFAIDEAHCVSQWGHDFRPEYLQLGVLQERFPGVPRVALTATADERTRRELSARLMLTDAVQIVAGFDRPNICYRVVPRRNGREQLMRFLEAEHRGDAGIVYCLSRKRVAETAEWLRGRGWDALPYHAGLPGEVRQAHQDRFLNGEGVVMVATIAFGMGIDKSNLRFVAHLDLPRSLEAYYQETGRAGRDGVAADAWLAYGLQDAIALRNMVDGGEADEGHKRREREKIEAMLGFCELATCRRQALLRHFGEEHDGACGNCDNCLEPVAQWDATEAAQKALSCVYRTGQLFGVGHLIDVLLGKGGERIEQWGHQRLSTYGIGGELTAVEWRGVFRQLIARGLLAVDVAGHGSLKLTERSRAVLRGAERVLLRREAPRGRRVTPRPGGAREPRLVTVAQQPLWEALRARRRQLAEEQSVPPYVIFHDATLLAMLEHRPNSHAELLQLSGIGERKLARYGDAFLEVIREHASAAVPPS
jgi:ATP-dependent DNA helicase RecQ